MNKLTLGKCVCFIVCLAVTHLARAEIDANHTVVFLYSLAKAALRVQLQVHMIGVDGRAADGLVSAEIDQCNNENAQIEVDLTRAIDSTTRGLLSAVDKVGQLKDLYITCISACCIDQLGQPNQSSTTCLNTQDFAHKSFARTERLFFFTTRDGRVSARLPLAAYVAQHAALKSK